MVTKVNVFDEHAVLHDLKHYLPAQAPLKDFIHHNTLHAFQHQPFFDALRQASTVFGYKTSLSVAEYRAMYAEGRIRKDVLERVILDRHGAAQLEAWMQRTLDADHDPHLSKRVGALRAHWKSHYHIDLDSLVHPNLFRILNSYLDQGISIWHFPVWNKGFLESLKEMERLAMTSFFQTKRAKELLLNGSCSLQDLLKIVVGDEALFERYLFDQQFAHPGWSGLVSVVEDNPGSLLDPRSISLHDLICFELLLEIDALDRQFGKIWVPLSGMAGEIEPLFAPVIPTEQDEVKAIWQEAFEWSFYDEVLAGLDLGRDHAANDAATKFQAIFCIDDRSCSIRRHLEKLADGAKTYGTPGHFGIDTYYKPDQGRFHTKVCPAPLKPKHLIKEVGAGIGHARSAHFAKHSHGLFTGWFMAQTLGFWSAIKLMVNIFRPSAGPGTSLSFKHMSPDSKLTVESQLPTVMEDGLQVGFTLAEMADRVQSVLLSIGLDKDFAPLVYVIGHGSSSVNNTHYAGYDCGACSGRPGSVNARVFSIMANHPKVREILVERGIHIPASTQFLGGLHDTSRDELMFYDTELLNGANKLLHEANAPVFDKVLDLNAKERSRRFELTSSSGSATKVHERVKTRTVSLFEPRPELNHATNALCIIGKRSLTDHVFLDRRAFMNSYDHEVDPDGKYLLGILNAAAPVCGGINLEYFFSRVDNQKLGAGTKLPHNVMGLIGVANGIEGDLRPGLPYQMVEVHDPIRLMIIVEQFPDVVLKVIKTNPATFEWFENGWVHLVIVHPQSGQQFLFRNGELETYSSLTKKLDVVSDLSSVLESSVENLPVMIIN